MSMIRQATAGVLFRSVKVLALPVRDAGAPSGAMKAADGFLDTQDGPVASLRQHIALIPNALPESGPFLVVLKRRVRGVSLTLAEKLPQEIIVLKDWRKCCMAQDKKTCSH